MYNKITLFHIDNNLIRCKILKKKNVLNKYKNTKKQLLKILQVKFLNKSTCMIPRSPARSAYTLVHVNDTRYTYLTCFVLYPGFSK